MDEIKNEPTFKEWVTEHASLVLIGGGFAITAIGLVLLRNNANTMVQDLESVFYQIGRDVGTLEKKVSSLENTVAKLKK